MGKQLFIAEKPSVAQEFARTLGIKGGRHDGYLETDAYIVTWCYGHLVTMSYPDAYDPALKKWSMETLPFLPKEFKYEIISSGAQQFRIVSSLLARDDVERIYVCTDSGREGEYIYRLVEMMSPEAVKKKERRRVWIDSFTEEEIRRGISEAKPISAYDHLSDSAFLRAKEDYLMGINFSRVLSLKYGRGIADYRGGEYAPVAVGRVMTCVLGMIVRREREIRDFKKEPFFRVVGTFDGIDAEWKAVSGSFYEKSPKLYKENGFKERAGAEELISGILPAGKCSSGNENLKARVPMSTDSEHPFIDVPEELSVSGTVLSVSRRKERKNAPLLYNLAELQNDCSRMFRISPDQTLKVAQELYEKKLTTYPRTDARVLSSAVAKVIRTNISGLTGVGSDAGSAVRTSDSGTGRGSSIAELAHEVLAGDAWKSIGRTRYTNDKAITDHYAIIPTGAGLGALNSLSSLSRRVYEQICRRFLAIFYPPAVYEKTAVEIVVPFAKPDGTGETTEHFFANTRVLKEEGYLKALGRGKSAGGKNAGGKESDSSRGKAGEKDAENGDAGEGLTESAAAMEKMRSLRKGMKLAAEKFAIKEGETKPPSRYNSGSIILAMENAGQLIEDDELREQIKGSGIGTSATRAEILAKLIRNGYIALNKKTQILTPELLGEMIYDVVNSSIRPLLNAELTASWEKGLAGVAEGSISTDEYMEKLEGFVARRTNYVKGLDNQSEMRRWYDYDAQFYRQKKPAKASGGRKGGRTGWNRKSR